MSRNEMVRRLCAELGEANRTGPRGHQQAAGLATEGDQGGFSTPLQTSPDALADLTRLLSLTASSERVCL